MTSKPTKLSAKCVVPRLHALCRTLLEEDEARSFNLFHELTHVPPSSCSTAGAPTVQASNRANTVPKKKKDKSHGGKKRKGRRVASSDENAASSPSTTSTSAPKMAGFDIEAGRSAAGESEVSPLCTNVLSCVSVCAAITNTNLFCSHCTTSPCIILDIHQSG